MTTVYLYKEHATHTNPETPDRFEVKVFKKLSDAQHLMGLKNDMYLEDRFLEWEGRTPMLMKMKNDTVHVTFSIEETTVQ